MGLGVMRQVQDIDPVKHRGLLGMKLLVPTSLDEYSSKHIDRDVVTGRMTEVSGGRARVELGEGIQATCKLSAEVNEEDEKPAESKADLSSMSSMLAAKWKGGQGGGVKREAPRSGQIRSFKIVKLDPAAKKIELELA